MLKASVVLIFMLLALYMICVIDENNSVAPLSDKDKIILAQKINRSSVIFSTKNIDTTDKLDFISYITGVKMNSKTGLPELALMYKAEDMSSQVHSIVDDPDAHGGTARHASLDKHPVCHLVYGPYDTLPAGKYRVCYRLKTSDCLTTEVITKIDIAAQCGNIILNQKEIKGNEFSSGDLYQTFYLNFVLNRETPDIEYRVFFTNKADLCVDSITVKPDF